MCGTLTVLWPGSRQRSAGMTYSASMRSAICRAKRAAEQATLARERIEQRVNRATAERENYLTENGPELLAELRPDCDQVVADMRAAAEALILADRRWRELSTVVAGHLRAMKLVPHQNSVGTHGFESVITDMRRALQHDIASPAPHLHTQRAAHDEHSRVAELRREREQAAA